MSAYMAVSIMMRTGFLHLDNCGWERVGMCTAGYILYVVYDIIILKCIVVLFVCMFCFE